MVYNTRNHFGNLYRLNNMQHLTIKTEDIKTNLVLDDDNPHHGYARAIRSQADNQGDYWSELTSTINTEESMVRPEFGKEADINYILQSHGVANATRAIKFGEEIDFTLDLQQAMMATDHAARAHKTIPVELQQKYPTYQSWLNAIDSGQYMSDLQDLTEKKRRKHEKEEREKAEEKPGDEPPDPQTDTKKKPKASAEGVS